MSCEFRSNSPRSSLAKHNIHNIHALVEYFSSYTFVRCHAIVCLWLWCDMFQVDVLSFYLSTLAHTLLTHETLLGNFPPRRSHRDVACMRFFFLGFFFASPRHAAGGKQYQSGEWKTTK